MSCEICRIKTTSNQQMNELLPVRMSCMALESHACHTYRHFQGHGVGEPCMPHLPPFSGSWRWRAMHATLTAIFRIMDLESHACHTYRHFQGHDLGEPRMPHLPPF